MSMRAPNLRIKKVERNPSINKIYLPTEEEGAETERHVNLNKFKKDGKNNSVKNIGRKTRRKNVEKGKWGKNINKIKNEKK